MTEDQFIHLLQGFREGRLSEGELLSFLQAAEDPRFESIVGEKLLQELAQMKTSAIADEQRADKVWGHISASMGHSANRPATLISMVRKSWLKYAAAIILLLGVAGYLLMSDKGQQPMQAVNTDIAPGREGAVLTLADGTRILLDSIGNGTVAEQDGTKISLQDGKLAYNATGADAVNYNTMSTPNGRQFSIQLPDGSRAWLNAASSITYPTAFIGEERPVTISGEVYFEVVKDAKRPFRVNVNNQAKVEVLGTSFNVRAYAGDPSINTTLLEGAVRMSAGKEIRSLKPGQQTLVMPDGTIQLNPNADIQKAMAWKNGLFNFQDESLEEVMKQLERWYDIKVKYIGDPPPQKFYGELQRDLTLSQVIESLKEIGIKFAIEGRTVIVKP